MPNEPPSPSSLKFRRFESNLGRWFVYDFVLPGTLLMHSVGKPVADAEGDLRNAVQLHSGQTLTPETETSTHCVFQQSHRVGHGGATVTELIYNSLVTAFEEDRAMITAQHQALLRRPEAPMLPLAMDAALLQLPRLVAEAVAAESATAPTRR